MRRPDPLPLAVLDVARRQEGLVDVRQLLDGGLTSARITRNVRYGLLTRAARGVYDVVAVPVTARRADPDTRRGDLLEHRRRRDAWLGVLAHGPQAVAVGQTALVLHGVQGLPLTPQIEVTRIDRRDRISPAGVILRRYGPLRYFDAINGRLLVPVPVALAQSIPTLQRRDAVAVLDSAQHLGLIDTAGLLEARALARGRRNVAQTHDWWDLTDQRAESPPESWTRVDCSDAGVAPDVLQQEFVTADGRVLARCDLAWWLGNGLWLLVEIDGRSVHDAPQALYRDRERQNLLVTAGHVVVRFSGADARAGLVGREVRQMLVNLGWQPGRTVPAGPYRLPF